VSSPRAFVRTLALTLLAGCGGASHMFPVAQVGPSSLVRPQYAWRNAIGPRYQWNHNWGYCGEVSLLSAGLYYGQYISQYDARAAADRLPQYRKSSQLLLGVNALRAANVMHLDAVAQSSRDTDDFLVWVKRNVVLGRPVAIGIFMNQFRFYGNRNRGAGSPQYDHIVPVLGIDSAHPRDARGYHADDVITFSDNGEWSSGLHDARYFFSYTFGAFQKTRERANARHGPIYSLSDDSRDFGLAIDGVKDLDGETVPVRVTTNVNYEKPQIVEGSSKRPPPERLVLTITVSGLRHGSKYNLYRYNSLLAIPDAAFNANASRAYEKWVITDRGDGEYVMIEKIMSDEVAAYRAVSVSAP
jgi:hypothetical protein